MPNTERIQVPNEHHIMSQDDSIVNENVTNNDTFIN